MSLQPCKIHKFLTFQLVGKATATQAKTKQNAAKQNKKPERKYDRPNPEGQLQL